jgi:ABC-2 type transport system ATP-binding protein
MNLEVYHLYTVFHPLIYPRVLLRKSFMNLFQKLISPELSLKKENIDNDIYNGICHNSKYQKYGYEVLLVKLEVSHLNKSYGNKPALIDFTLDFTPGVYGLLGPNGAGKTTLMSIIAGHLAQGSGEVTFNGEDTKAMGNRFRDILGYMPQQQNLYDQFSARRFLRYMASLKGLPKTLATERIEKLIDLVNLKNDAHRSLGGFSGGMKQRVLIAQALLNDPQVLLMDEPTAGLDPRERIKIRNFISEIAFSKIVILATHVVSDIEYIAKDVILLDKGRILMHDEPAEILTSMQGRVYELTIPEPELQQVRGHYKISNITKDHDAVTARIVAATTPEGYSARTVKPNMEDVYLNFFED